jgi:IS30 family transposase
LAGFKSRAIGRELGRHHSSICDEIARGRDSSGNYCPHLGQLRRDEASARSAANSVCRPYKLWQEAGKKLARGWSPETIHGRWKLLGKPTISTPALYAGAKRRDWQGHFHRNRIRAHLKRPARRPWPGKARSIHERGEDANLRIERGRRIASGSC